MNKRYCTILMAAAGLSACQPSNLQYQPTMSRREMAASENYIRQVDDENIERSNRINMNDARATEMATRHNPTHVTENRTSFFFW